MSGLLTDDPGELAGDLPPEMRAMMGGLGGFGGLGEMMRRIGGMMVGGQAGAAVGALAEEIISSSDIGLPLGPQGTAALLPAGVAAFGSGLSVEADEVRLFLALREAAHHRLFGHVPWLRSRLLGAVEDYARGIKVDASALRDAMPQIDPSNPEALNEALLSGAAMFQPEDTPEQKQALARLETMLALVEGWVATVVAAAADGPAAAGGRAGRGHPPPPGHRRSRGTDVRDPGRAGTAAAAAARGWRDLAGGSPPSAGWPAGTRSGLTPTCCPQRTTSTIRTGSSAVGPNWISPAWMTKPDRTSRSTRNNRTGNRCPQHVDAVSAPRRLRVHVRAAGVHTPSTGRPQRHAALSPRSAQGCAQAAIDATAKRA